MLHIVICTIPAFLLGTVVGGALIYDMFKSEIRAAIGAPTR